MCALCALKLLYLCVKCLFNHKIVGWLSTNEIRPTSCELLLAISCCLSFFSFPFLCFSVLNFSMCVLRNRVAVEHYFAHTVFYSRFVAFNNS